MIRRDLPADGPLPARWVLIPQIEHAHLAGRLAEHWGAGGFAPLRPKDELLWAVYHHDDGWRDWDQAPDVDPKRGWPRAFTEMAIDDSLAIWSGSIEVARRAGHLEGSRSSRSNDTGRALFRPHSPGRRSVTTGITRMAVATGGGGTTRETLTARHQPNYTQ